MLKYIVVIFISFILVGCSGNREPLIPQTISGAKKTKDWLKYNKYAENNNKPYLDYFAIEIKPPSKEGLGKKDQIKNYQFIKSDDEAIYTYGKFSNMNIGDFVEFRTYLPDGREYDYDRLDNTKYKDQLWVWDRIHIKNEQASDFPGVWNTKIFINGKYVMTNTFILDLDKKTESLKPNIRLGVLGLRSKNNSKYKFGQDASEYIAHGILNINKNIEIVSPKELKQNLPNVDIPEDKYEISIKEDLTLENSLLVDYASKHNLDYLIIGLSEAALSGNSFNIGLETYLIDIKSKKLITKQKTSYAVSNAEARSLNMAQQGWRSVYLKAYNKNLKALTNNILSIKP